MLFEITINPHLTTASIYLLNIVVIRFFLVLSVIAI
jgi:hypothetical protein